MSLLFSGWGLVVLALVMGILILKPHCLQRTLLPRAVAGTESTVLQRRLGQTILTILLSIGTTLANLFLKYNLHNGFIGGNGLLIKWF